MTTGRYVHGNADEELLFTVAIRSDQPYLYVYRYDENANALVDYDDDWGLPIDMDLANTKEIGVSAGDVDGDGTDEIGVIGIVDINSKTFAAITLLDTDENGRYGFASYVKIPSHITLDGTYTSADIAMADFDGDGQAEVAAKTSYMDLIIYEITDDMPSPRTRPNYTLWFGKDYYNEASYTDDYKTHHDRADTRIEVSDVDFDGWAEVITLANRYQDSYWHVWLNVYDFDSEYNRSNYVSKK
ncbi:MAG: FG-GAP-like repeat-containing protein [Desulfobacterales bacterium]|nr:FG-GAP-like repeat-containing protein [Desulfobacterales bacterium]